MILRIDTIPIRNYADGSNRISWALMHKSGQSDVCVESETSICKPIYINYEPLFVGPDDAPADPADYYLVYVITSPVGVPLYSKTVDDLKIYEAD